MEMTLREMKQEIEEANRCVQARWILRCGFGFSTDPYHRQLILSQLEVEDAEVRKERLKEQVEVAKARSVEAKALLNAQDDIRAKLAAEISQLKSPEDYRRDLASRHEILQEKRGELAAEQQISIQLQARLEEFREATEKKKQLQDDMTKLRQLRTSVLTEIAMMDRKQVKTQNPQETIRKLEEQLQEAQGRFQYLCSHQMMMQ